MNKGAARITYLYNSGFAVETLNHMLIFDYCLTIPAGNQKKLTSGVITHEELDAKPNVTVFVSHGHKDHFNAAILRWYVKHKNIRYVFSDDIPMADSVILLNACKKITIDDMRISAFPSTDVGISILVEVDGLSIFHAGDLNLWHSKMESMDEESSFAFKKAKYAFMKALIPIREHKMDIAFFPVDPRIGPGYDVGALYFAEHFRPKYFVPMHFGENYEVCQYFFDKVHSLGIDVAHIEARGQQFIYQKDET